MHLGQQVAPAGHDLAPHHPSAQDAVLVHLAEGGDAHEVAQVPHAELVLHREGVDPLACDMDGGDEGGMAAHFGHLGWLGQLGAPLVDPDGAHGVAGEQEFLVAVQAGHSVAYCLELAQLLYFGHILVGLDPVDLHFALAVAHKYVAIVGVIGIGLMVDDCGLVVYFGLADLLMFAIFSPV